MSVNKGWPKHSHTVLFTYFLRLLSDLDEQWVWLGLWPIKPVTLLSLALYEESASPWDSLIPDSPFPPISVTCAPWLSSHLEVFKWKQNRIRELDIWQVENGGVKVVKWEESGRTFGGERGMVGSAVYLRQVLADPFAWEEHKHHYINSTLNLFIP